MSMFIEKICYKLIIEHFKSRSLNVDGVFSKAINSFLSILRSYSNNFLTFQP